MGKNVIFSKIWWPFWIFHILCWSSLDFVFFSKIS